jgi:hypothetical protein
MKSFTFPGFAGENPLGFLASLGLLRTLSDAQPEWMPRLNWIQSGTWRPVLSIARDASEDSLLDVLSGALEAKRTGFAQLLEKNDLEPNLKFSRKDFVEFWCGHRTEAGCRYVVRAVAELPLKKELVSVSLLRMVNGSGHQDFFPIINEIAAATTNEHLRATLFGPWQFNDDGRNRSLRWDPADKREYALRWKNPSSDPSKVQLGANRLAIEALPLLPVQPAAFRAVHTGFHYEPQSRQTWFRWPIWSLLEPATKELSAGLTIATAQCLLDLPAMENPIQYRRELRAWGIAIVYESLRLQDSYYDNFAPSRAVPL